MLALLQQTTDQSLWHSNQAKVTLPSQKAEPCSYTEKGKVEGQMQHRPIYFFYFYFF